MTMLKELRKISQYFEATESPSVSTFRENALDSPTALDNFSTSILKNTLPLWGFRRGLRPLAHPYRILERPEIKNDEFIKSIMESPNSRFHDWREHLAKMSPKQFKTISSWLNSLVGHHETLEALYDEKDVIQDLGSDSWTNIINEIAGEEVEGSMNHANWGVMGNVSNMLAQMDAPLAREFYVDVREGGPEDAFLRSLGIDFGETVIPERAMRLIEGLPNPEEYEGDYMDQPLIQLIRDAVKKDTKHIPVNPHFIKEEEEAREGEPQKTAQLITDRLPEESTREYNTRLRSLAPVFWPEYFGSGNYVSQRTITNETPLLSNDGYGYGDQRKYERMNPGENADILIPGRTVNILGRPTTTEDYLRGRVNEQPTLSLSPSDRDALSRMVHAESGNQSTEGQLAVLSSMLNRFAAPERFGNAENIIDILEQKTGNTYAYSALDNTPTGSVWELPEAPWTLENTINPHLKDYKDVSMGNTFYLNPNITEPEHNFMTGYPTEDIYTIGDHDFANYFTEYPPIVIPKYDVDVE